MLDDFGRGLFAAVQTCGAMVSAHRAGKSLDELQRRLHDQLAGLTDEEVAKLAGRYPWILDGGTPKPSPLITS